MKFKSAKNHPHLHRPALAVRFSLALVALAFAIVLPVSAAPANLVRNGGFDDAPDPLAGWYREYKLPGESFYAGNAAHVSVVRDGERPHVLKLDVVNQGLADNQGVKAESFPIPLDPAKRYRFSADARSAGPSARIMLEGYEWKPGVTPHENPERSELRMVYRFPVLQFGKGGAAEMPVMPKEWHTGTLEIPSPDLKPLGRKFFAKVKFVMVHAVAIGGKAGPVFLDNVTLEVVAAEKVEKAEQKEVGVQEKSSSRLVGKS